MVKAAPARPPGSTGLTRSAGAAVFAYPAAPPAEAAALRAPPAVTLRNLPACQPADPVEPCHGLDSRTWALIRHDEPHSAASWRATLSCGHTDRAVHAFE